MDETIKQKIIYFTTVFFSIATASAVFGFEGKQIISFGIVAGLISATFLFWKMRVAFAFFGVSLLFIFALMDVPHFVEFASLDIIAFLIAMMVIVGYLEENKFFEYVTGRILNAVGGDPSRVLVVLLLLAGVSAAFVDEVTSILIMLGITLHLVNKLNLNPVPFVIMLVFTTNIGSSATVVGNPVGVLIAMRGGLSFADFIRWATPIALLSLFATIALLFWYYKKEISEFSRKMRKKKGMFIEKIEGRNLLYSTVLFIGVLLLLLLHTQVEGILGLKKNSMLIGTAFLGAGIALLLEGENARKLLETRVDWWTLIFFMLLFSTVGALQYSGATEKFSQALSNAIGPSPEQGIGVIMVASGLLSAILDNVLAVAIFIPIIQNLLEQGIGTEFLWWALLFGGTFSGNLTIIGSTANVVALGMLERRQGLKISFMEWIKVGVLVTIPTIIIAFIALVLQVRFL